MIEDDYDGEFRLYGEPISAVQTLDPDGSVFYVGTFSKCLLPELRVGFIVAPAWARSALGVARQVSGGGSWLVQETLASFIADGHLANHIRKTHRIYEKRRTTLLGAINRHCGGQLKPVRSVAGLHLSAMLAPSIDARAVATRAADLGVGIHTLERYAIASSELNGLVFCYGQMEVDQIDEAIRIVARAIANVQRAARVS